YRGNGEEARAGASGLTFTLNVDVTSKGRPERGGLFHFLDVRRRPAAVGDRPDQRDVRGTFLPDDRASAAKLWTRRPDKDVLAKKLLLSSWRAVLKSDHEGAADSHSLPRLPFHPLPPVAPLPRSRQRSEAGAGVGRADDEEERPQHGDRQHRQPERNNRRHLPAIKEGTGHEPHQPQDRQNEAGEDIILRHPARQRQQRQHRGDGVARHILLESRLPHGWSLSENAAMLKGLECAAKLRTRRPDKEADGQQVSSSLISASGY